MKTRKRRWDFAICDRAYRRRLAVRAIEDACVLLMMGVGVWTVCVTVGFLLRIMGAGA